jgi:hypothetical protein
VAVGAVKSTRHSRPLAWALGVLSATTLLAVSLLPVASGVTSAAEVADCATGWRETPVTTGVTGEPFAIVTRKGQPAWIVGGTNGGALALRWVDGRWVRRQLTGDHQGFVGAISSGAGAFLGVGYRRRAKGDFQEAMAPFAQRVTVGSRQDLQPRRPTAAHSAFADVARSGARTWAVGTRLLGGHLLPNVAYRLHGDWRFANPPVTREGGLLAVDRGPDGRIWAVGWEAAASGRYHPYIVSRNGSKWRRSRLPASLGRAVLTDISFSAHGSAWAVGYRWRPGTDRVEPLLLRKVAGKWRRQPGPWSKIAGIPQGIAAGPHNEVWVVGTSIAIDARETRGFLAHRTRAGHWSLTYLATDADTRSEVTGVAATSDGAIATGRVGPRVFALESCPAPVTPARRLRIAIEGSTRMQFEDQLPRPVSLSRVASRPVRIEARGLVPASAPGGLLIRDVAVDLGIAERTGTWGGFAFDLDRDGRRDAFFSRHAGPMPRTWLVRKDRLERGNTAAFSRLDRHGCDAADVDGDGRIDILCAGGKERGKVIDRHELSLAATTPAARLVRGGLGISDPLGRGRLVAFLRLNRDRYPEVFIADRPERDDGLPSTSRFYRNVDFDRDHDDDLLICTDYGVGGRPPGLRVMRNEGGRLVDRTRALGVRPMRDRDVAIANLDGRNGLDIVQLSRNKLKVSLRQRNGRFRVVWKQRITNSKAIGLGDASGDGRPDIYVVRGAGSGNQPDRLLINRGDGRGYRGVAIPQVSDGAGDDVIVFDHDGNGRDDFLVLNGSHRTGPIQLLASYPAR